MCLLPSEYWYRQGTTTFQQDPCVGYMAHQIGVDNLMWGSDYPHAESTWPRSQQFLEDLLAGCTDEEKAKIAGGNVAKLYGFN